MSTQYDADHNRARTVLQEALYEMRRMDFDLINALIFASNDDAAFCPSDKTLFHLQRQARDLVKKIDEASERLWPHARKILGDRSEATKNLSRLVEHDK